MCHRAVVPIEVAKAPWPRHCQPSDVNISNTQEDYPMKSAALCNIYSSPIKIRGRWYKNGHCAMNEKAFGIIRRR